MASTSSSADAEYKHSSVNLGGRSFDALVADTEVLREKGLGDRDSLASGQAMLFIFDKPDNLGFWMKDMRFSIDMLWLDEGFKVVSFTTDVSPNTYPKVFYPTSLSEYVLEFPAGTLSSLGLKAGEQISVSSAK